MIVMETRSKNNAKENAYMLESKRLLQKTPTYYENAMQQANSLSLFNQSTLQKDFHLHIFWSRYIHYDNHAKIPANTSFHAHSFYEMHCVLNGIFEYQEKIGTSKQIEAGNFILIAPQNTHRLKPITPDAETFAVTFEPICDDTEQGNKIKVQFEAITSLDGEIDSEACQLIELILQEFHDNRAFCDHNVKSLLTLLIIDLIRDLFVKKIETIT